MYWCIEIESEMYSISIFGFLKKIMNLLIKYVCKNVWRDRIIVNGFKVFFKIIMGIIIKER